MLFSYFAIVVIFIVGYVFLMDCMEDEVVEDNIVIYPIQAEVESEDAIEDIFENEAVNNDDQVVGSISIGEDKAIVGVQCFVPKIVNEPRPKLKPKQKPDLREQYRIWIENARSVNESYQREYSLRTQGSA